MERKQEKEIRDYLEKIGLQYSAIEQDEGSGKYYIGSLFKTIAFIEGDFKWNLKCSLKDVISLLEDYIRKIDEN